MKQYKVTNVLAERRGIPTEASKRYQYGDMITTSELKQFCRVYGLIYEAGVFKTGKYTEMRAVDIHMNIHLEAWLK